MIEIIKFKLYITTSISIIYVALAMVGVLELHIRLCTVRLRFGARLTNLRLTGTCTAIY